MVIDVDRHGSFHLDDELVEPYRARAAPWGFGALSWVVFKRTYARDGEEWWQTCRRVIEGTFTVQRVHCRERGLAWDEGKAQKLAQTAYERMWSFKWTPPGRGLWIMGTRFMYERGGEALNNCGFISTKDLADDYAAPFEWITRMSMLGVGVGFDTRGKNITTIQKPQQSQQTHVIEDTREGWVAALGRLLGAFVGKAALPRSWDYSNIRPAGTSLDSFGGYASGPKPLEKMLNGLEDLYRGYVGQRADSRLIVDTMNLIGRCVVAGGIRHSAQIAFGEPGDTQFLDLKLDEEKVTAYRWASNNSVFAEVGMDYADVARRTAVNGEPGYLWLDNARAYGRMGDEPNGADEAAAGSNPCVEQTLWDRELCCLVETYPAHHERFEDFRRTLRVAYLYAKTVTLVPTRDEGTNAIMQQNRRVGCSMTGIVQAISRLGYRRFFQWCDRAYDYVQQLDREYSTWLRVPRSIKTTSVKPSGTVSLLAGATPGVHWDHAPYYIRRMRVGAEHPLVDMCRQAGYQVEPSIRADDMVVIAFPVHVKGLRRCRREVPLWEKVDLAAQMQHYWSDNQVSCTADFPPESGAEEIARVLSAYEDRLKAIAFVPAARHGYEQPPYEEISHEEYEALAGKLDPLRGEIPHEHQLEARFCEGGACDVA
jgi:ribonucleoside-triphosphate reductase